VIEPELFEDDRGFFFESYNQKNFEKAIGRKINFVQDNHSNSVKGVLRGLHIQDPPYAQAKLIRVINGKVWDVAVDVRKNSSTFGNWVAETLSSENKKQLWIPEGFAHGFYVLSEIAEVVYKVNRFYSIEHQRTIHWKKNNFSIQWPVKNDSVLLSKADANA
jgi:dTDP-4-dehydrorhamnose 3,5-epimerase